MKTSSGTILLPFKRGPVEQRGPLWITASRLSFSGFWTLTTAGPAALRMRAGWPEMPGAVGLSMRIDPLRRASWTVSVWENQAANRAFVDSPAHLAIMTAYGAHGVTGTEIGWAADTLDLDAAWERAAAELGAQPAGRAA